MTHSGGDTYSLPDSLGAGPHTDTPCWGCISGSRSAPPSARLLGVRDPRDLGEASWGGAQPWPSRAWPPTRTPRLRTGNPEPRAKQAAKGLRFTPKGPTRGLRTQPAHHRLPPPQPGFRPSRKEQEFGMLGTSIIILQGLLRPRPSPQGGRGKGRSLVCLRQGGVVYLQGRGPPWRLAETRSRGCRVNRGWGKARAPGPAPTSGTGAQEGGGEARVLAGVPAGRPHWAEEPRPAGPPTTGRVGAAAAFPPGKQLWGTADAPSDAASDTCLAAPAAALWTQHHPSLARPWQGTSSTNHQSLFWDCFFLETGSWGVGHTSPRSRPRRGQSRVGVWTHGNSPSCPALAALWRPMEPQVYTQNRGEGRETG